MSVKTSTRVKVRRKLDQTADHCDVINQYLADINDIYKETHVDISDALFQIGEITEMLRSLIVSVRSNI